MQIDTAEIRTALIERARQAKIKAERARLIEALAAAFPELTRPKTKEAEMQTIIPNDTPVISAANQAAKSNLHLVIDRHGRTFLSPVVIPGTWKLGVSVKEKAA